MFVFSKEAAFGAAARNGRLSETKLQRCRESPPKRIARPDPAALAQAVYTVEFIRRSEEIIRISPAEGR